MSEDNSIILVYFTFPLWHHSELPCAAQMSLNCVWWKYAEERGLPRLFPSIISLFVVTLWVGEKDLRQHLGQPFVGYISQHIVFIYIYGRPGITLHNN